METFRYLITRGIQKAPVSFEALCHNNLPGAVLVARRLLKTHKSVKITFFNQEVPLVSLNDDGDIRYHDLDMTAYIIKTHQSMLDVMQKVRVSREYDDVMREKLLSALQQANEECHFILLGEMKMIKALLGKESSPD